MMKLMNIIIKSGYYLLAIHGLILLIIWFIDHRSVIEFSQGSIEPIEIKAGDRAVVIQPIKKLLDCYGRVYRYIHGECGMHSIMQGETIIDKGFNGDLIIPFIVPYSAIPGQCEFDTIHHYYCNPLDFLFNRREYKINPIKFKIVK